MTVGKGVECIGCHFAPGHSVRMYEACINEQTVQTTHVKRVAVGDKFICAP